MRRFHTVYSVGYLFAAALLLSFTLLAQDASAQLSCGATDKATLLSVKNTLDPNGVLNWEGTRAFDEWDGIKENAGSVDNDDRLKILALGSQLGGGYST